MPSEEELKEISEFSVSQDTENHPNTFYVEREVISEQYVTDYVKQQTLDPNNNYSYDDCYNVYCKSEFKDSSTDNITNIQHSSKERLHEFPSSHNSFLSGETSNDENHVRIKPVYQQALDRLFSFSESQQQQNYSHSSETSTLQCLEEDSTCHPTSSIDYLESPESPTVSSTIHNTTMTFGHSDNTREAQVIAPVFSSTPDDGDPGTTTGSHVSPEMVMDRSNLVGIAAYIEDEASGTVNSNIRGPQSQTPPTQRSKHQSRQQRKRPPEPWYCVSRPISEQTKDLKIRQVNRSSSIHFGKLLEKCRSIMEYCTLQGGLEEPNAESIKEMNHNHDWGDNIPADVKGKTVRVVYQNVQRSVNATDNPLTDTLLNNLHKMEADVFMGSETNVN